RPRCGEALSRCGRRAGGFTALRCAHDRAHPPGARASRRGRCRTRAETVREAENERRWTTERERRSLEDDETNLPALSLVGRGSLVEFPFLAKEGVRGRSTMHTRAFSQAALRTRRADGEESKHDAQSTFFVTVCVKHCSPMVTVSRVLAASWLAAAAASHL